MSCADCMLGKRCDGVNEIDCNSVPDASFCYAGLVVKCFQWFKLNNGVCTSCDFGMFCDGVN